MEKRLRARHSVGHLCSSIGRQGSFCLNGPTMYGVTLEVKKTSLTVLQIIFVWYLTSRFACIMVINLDLGFYSDGAVVLFSRHW